MKKPVMLVIDDEKFYLNYAKIQLDRYAEVKVFEGDRDFKENASKRDISEAEIALVDYELDGKTAIDLDLYGTLRSMGFRGDAYLWSLFTDFGRETDKIRGSYMRVLSKDDNLVENLFK